MAFMYPVDLLFLLLAKLDIKPVYFLVPLCQAIFQPILAFITAMGGLEAVKWMVRYISCRKTDARKEEADVSSLEEENRRKKVDWLEDRLAQRDEKIDGLYIELRKVQEEKQGL